MTAHEIFVSLFWLVVIAYLTFLVWFGRISILRIRRGRVRHGSEGAEPSVRPHRGERRAAATPGGNGGDIRRGAGPHG
jgi:hypothetical protein